MFTLLLDYDALISPLGIIIYKLLIIYAVSNIFNDILLIDLDWVSCKAQSFALKCRLCRAPGYSAEESCLLRWGSVTEGKLRGGCHPEANV